MVFFVAREGRDLPQRPTSDSIVSKTFKEDYSLDQLNNRAAYYRDHYGGSPDELVQTRVHNNVIPRNCVSSPSRHAKATNSMHRSSRNFLSTT